MSKKAAVLLVVLSVASSIFAANPADLTVFERSAYNNYIKLIYGEKGSTAFVALPPIGNDFVISFQAWQDGKNDKKKYTGRLIRRFSPHLDAALIAEFALIEGVSNIDNKLVFDLHGELFGLPAGIGLSLPLDEKESVKVGPRISMDDFAFYATIAEKNEYIFGATYARSSYKVEVAYSTEDILHVRASKGFKTSVGKVCPEIRMKFLPDEEVFEFGLGIFF